MLPYIKDYLLNNWVSLSLGGNPPEDLYGVILGRRGRETRSFLVFHSDSKLPTCIVKAGFTDEARAILRAEYENLCWLHKQTTPIFRQTIPRPLALQEINGALCLIESVIPGRFLGYGRQNPFGIPGTHKRLKLVYEWLTLFHHETALEDRILDNTSIHEVIVEPLQQGWNRFGMHDKSTSVLRTLERIAQRLEGKRLPVVALHGDFKVEHVLYLGGSMIGVVDWAEFRQGGLPFFDWFSFLISYGLGRYKIDTSGTLSKFVPMLRNVFCEQHSFSQALAYATRDYCTALGLDKEAVPVFFALYLVKEGCTRWPFFDRNKGEVFEDALRMFVENWHKLSFLQHLYNPGLFLTG